MLARSGGIRIPGNGPESEADQLCNAVASGSTACHGCDTAVVDKTYTPFVGIAGKRGATPMLDSFSCRLLTRS